MSRLHYLLRLPRAALRRRVPLAALLRHATGRPATPTVVHAFRLSSDEQRFADALTGRHAQFWLYRAHQRAFCGDRNRHRAVAALARTGIVAPDIPVEPLVGDRRVVLAHIARTLMKEATAC